VLTHTVELPDSERFECEIQFYDLAIYGRLGESFGDVYEALSADRPPPAARWESAR
jgi:hypothetical protein